MVWFLFGISAVVFLALALMYFKKQKQSGSQDPEGRDSMHHDDNDGSIRSADPGDLISIEAISDLSKDYKEIVFEVRNRNRYESDGEQWFEYVGQVGDITYYIEWVEEDELVITGTSSRDRYKLSDIGATEEDLARMDEDESDENYIMFKGKKFFYESSGEVFFYKNGKGGAEGFYLWDFISEEGREMISVEKWESEPFEIHHCFIISPDHIQVVKR